LKNRLSGKDIGSEGTSCAQARSADHCRQIEVSDGSLFLLKLLVNGLLWKLHLANPYNVEPVWLFPLPWLVLSEQSSKSDFTAKLNASHQQSNQAAGDWCLGGATFWGRPTPQPASCNPLRLPSHFPFQLCSLR
jgi:hypothetical protein